VIKPHLGHFATNHGSFIVLALAEEPATKKEVKKALKPYKKEIEAAASEGNAGSKVLLTHL